MLHAFWIPVILIVIIIIVIMLGLLVFGLLVLAMLLVLPSVLIVVLIVMMLFVKKLPPELKLIHAFQGRILGQLYLQSKQSAQRTHHADDHVKSEQAICTRTCSALAGTCCLYLPLSNRPNQA